MAPSPPRPLDPDPCPRRKSRSALSPLLTDPASQPHGSSWETSAALVIYSPRQLEGCRRWARTGILLPAVRKAQGGSPPCPSEPSRPPVPARHTAISPGAWAREVPVTSLGRCPASSRGRVPYLAPQRPREPGCRSVHPWRSAGGPALRWTDGGQVAGGHFKAAGKASPFLFSQRSHRKPRADPPHVPPPAVALQFSPRQNLVPRGVGASGIYRRPRSGRQGHCCPDPASTPLCDTDVMIRAHAAAVRSREENRVQLLEEKFKAAPQTTSPWGHRVGHD